MKKLEIIYRAGRENGNADALSCAPTGPPPAEPVVTDSQVMAVTSITVDTVIDDLAKLGPVAVDNDSLANEQQKDSDIMEMLLYLTKDQLPDCNETANKILATAPLFTVVDGILYFLDSKKGGRKRCVVPRCLRQSIMEENPVVQCLGTSQVSDYTSHCRVTGGGRTCTVMLFIIAPHALSVLL